MGALGNVGAGDGRPRPSLPGGLPASRPRSSPPTGGDLCRCAPLASETGDGCPIRGIGVGSGPDHLTK